ncbi:hypothetical protein H4582DRAFT_1982485 [Lactarius indigo]|nr:hypothetical protein H4582DRAFT_1982485 [Lactarius indigo]
MASHDVSPQVINGYFEVSSVDLGRGLVACIKNSFTGGRIKRGDIDMKRSRNLLKQHLRQLPLEEQHFIRQKFHEAREAKAKLGCGNISKLNRFILAMRYEKIAEYTFKVIESASNRLIDDDLMGQIPEAADEGAGHLTSNPFIDSHGISTLTDVNVHNLDSVRMETYRSATTGEMTVVMDLHGRDASTRQVVTTVSPETIVGDETRREGESNSIHSGTEIYGPRSEAGDDAGR